VGLLFTGSGSASFTFTAQPNSVIDPLEVDGPTVSISGSLSAPTATVLIKSGTFFGNASLAAGLFVGDSNANDDANVAPGTIGTIGTITAASLTLESDSVLKLEIDSGLASADKLTIGGAITLVAGAKLQVTDLGSVTPGPLLTLTIIENTSTEATNGTFEGLPDGTQFFIGTHLFQINYHTGPDLNDVALVLIPEPATIGGLLAGVGLLGLRRRRPGTR
jgi:hypothetical protein